MNLRTEKKSGQIIPGIVELIILIVLILLMAMSCKHAPLVTDDATGSTPSSPGNGNNGNPNQIPCDPDSVYFTNTILPLFISNCAKSGCHDANTAKEGIILDSYSNIMNTGDIQPFDPNAGHIVDAITESDPGDRMPPLPNTPLTSQQINTIITWINQGAKNNMCDACDTLNVTYSGKIKPILDLTCVGCHSGGNPSGNINLATYAGAALVALDGRLSGAVNHSAGYTSMPQGGNKLPQCEIDAIEIWVAQGAPNN